MALSKEEISIRLGINAKSVQAGLDSATGYISKWRKKQKTDEEAYTSFWVSEFNKREELAAAELDKRLESAKGKRAKHAQEVANYEARLAKKAAGGQEYLASLKQKEELEVASAVRAAERSNKASMLWRERAEKRELRAAEEQVESATRRNRARALLREREEKRNATAAGGLGGQDTMSRSVELANKEGKGVFAKASRQLGSYAGNVISGAVMGVVGMMTAMVTDLITRAVDKMSDYMSKTIYDTLEGINDRMVAYVDKQHDRKMAAKASSKEIADENNRMDKEEARAAFEKKSAEDRASISKDSVEATNKEMDAAKSAFEQAKRQQKELIALNKGSIEATAEGFELVAAAEKRILEARKANKAAMDDYGKALDDIKVVEASTGGPVPGAFSFAQPRFEQRPTGMAAVDDYMAKIKSGQDAYKSKTDYSQFGKAVAEAQKEAATEFVQKVSIVEINEQYEQ